MVKPECYTSIDEEWKVMGKCNRTKVCELSLVNWGLLRKAHSFRFLLVSPSLDLKILLSSECREGPVT